MSLEHRRPVADAEPPDIGFQAAFGFYLGLVAGGLVALVGLLADVTTATLLGTFPTVVTAVTLVGHVVAKRAHGLPERIGRRRRLRLACSLPAVGFAAAAVAPSVTSLEHTGRYLALMIGFALVLGVTALGLSSLCRNRYVEAITADEPAVTWDYRPASAFSQGGVWIVLLFFVVTAGGANAAVGDAFGLFWIAFGVVMAVVILVDVESNSNGKKYYGKRFSIETTANSENALGELHAHERGIRLDQGRSRKLTPWEKITDVELTDDELVLERRFRNLRCDRSAIDDPEAVLEVLLETRARAEEREQMAEN
ncbi:hypothetical protein CV102_01050 [Natronococcus pandeyae]|uniref:Uncharacterized protein n=2 Tax=Natronococcus pandeyae TaxID=2055836 RepID=A0A8J8Q8U2_9EURY|nr:hypothetical protein CV102_01050 [Natronococcus pandeyae]